MAIYVPSSNLLFIQTPGTGSTSIESALLHLDGARNIGSKHDGVQALAPYLIGELSTAISICFVRNPFDWYLSEWWRLRKNFIWDLLDTSSFYSQNPMKKKELVAACSYEFDKWIEFILLDMYELHKKKRSCVFNSWTHEVQKVFKFEEMDSFVQYLSGNNVNLDVPHHNKGGRDNPYWCYYSARARSIVQDIASVTLHNYNYFF